MPGTVEDSEPSRWPGHQHVSVKFSNILTLVQGKCFQGLSCRGPSDSKGHPQDLGQGLFRNVDLSLVRQCKWEAGREHHGGS